MLNSLSKPHPIFSDKSFKKNTIKVNGATLTDHAQDRKAETVALERKSTYFFSKARMYTTESFCNKWNVFHST